MSSWARRVEIYRHYAIVHIVEWTDKSPADVYRHYRQLGVDLPTPPASATPCTPPTERNPS